MNPPTAARPDRNRPESFGADYFEKQYGIVDCKPFSQHWWSVRLYSGITRRLLRRAGGRRLLEVGCGFGFILASLEDEFETFGVDISPHAIQQCARVTPRSRCAVANLEEGLPQHLEPDSFDLVLACYVFEHLHDPPAALARVVSLLRPGGFFFFSVPNTASIGHRWKGRDWYAYKDPTHCSLLPPETWLDYVRNAGLALEREFSDGYWDLPYVSWLPRWIQAPVFLAPCALTCLLARPVLPARFGENVIIIARRTDHSRRPDHP